MFICRGVDRREQSNLSLVATFSYRIGFCEARSTTRSGTATLLQVAFLTFYAWEKDTQKDEFIYKSDKSIGKRARTRVYVLQPSAPVLLLLRKNNHGRETFITKM